MLAGFANNGWNSKQAGALRSPPSAFPGNQLEKPVFQPANDDRLNQSVLPYRVGQFIETDLVEGLPRLVRIRKNPIDIDLAKLIGIQIRRAQQRVQAAAERFSLC